MSFRSREKTTEPILLGLGPSVLLFLWSPHLVFASTTSSLAQSVLNTTSTFALSCRTAILISDRLFANYVPMGFMSE